MKILILGATGMLGYSLFQNLSDNSNYDVYGTVRSLAGKESFFSGVESKLILGVDVSNIQLLRSTLGKIDPDVVINCIGLIKQHSISKQHVDAISINSLLPFQLGSICDQLNAKLIHFSTDCVFDGAKGGYDEGESSNATDLYGRSKALGEVSYKPHLTLRTSIIGHELDSSVSLIDWFLSEQGSVKGFSKAVFSGLPTCAIARLLADHILPASDLSGLYHLSVEPIDKYTLLKLVADIYGKKIDIGEAVDFEIDRSLNSERLQDIIKYKVPSWSDLIVEMHSDFTKRYKEFR